MDRTPKASILLLIGNQRERAARTLSSVLAQEGLADVEVLVLDSAASTFPPLPGSDHPQVRVIEPELKSHFGAMKAEGVRQARGEIVIFIEDHVLTDPGWLKSILAAFEGPWVAVGSQVENANGGVGMSDAVGLVGYGLWAPPVAKGEVRLLPGNNTAYRRQTLLDLGGSLADLLTTDTVLQWRLMADDGRLFLETDAVIHHLSPTSLRNCLLAEYYYHWPFAAVRARTMGWSRWQTLRYLLFSPLIPWLRLRRTIKLNAEKKVLSPAELLRSLPGLVVVLHAAVTGQVVGLLLGPERGIALFTDFELDCPRPVGDG